MHRVFKSSCFKSFLVLTKSNVCIHVTITRTRINHQEKNFDKLYEGISGTIQHRDTVGEKD